VAESDWRRNREEILRALSEVWQEAHGQR